MANEDSTYFLMLNSELNGIRSVAIFGDEVIIMEEINRFYIYINHALSLSGCLNKCLNVNVAQRGRDRTQSVLHLPRRYRTPGAGDIYTCLRIKSKNFNSVTKF